MLKVAVSVDKLSAFFFLLSHLLIVITLKAL